MDGRSWGGSAGIDAHSAHKKHKPTCDGSITPTVLLRVPYRQPGPPGLHMPAAGSIRSTSWPKQRTRCSYCWSEFPDTPLQSQSSLRESNSWESDPPASHRHSLSLTPCSGHHVQRARNACLPPELLRHYPLTRQQQQTSVDGHIQHVVGAWAGCTNERWDQAPGK
jgi:hypothetical protein